MPEQVDLKVQTFLYSTWGQTVEVQQSIQNSFPYTVSSEFKNGNCLWLVKNCSSSNHQRVHFILTRIQTRFKRYLVIKMLRLLKWNYPLLSFSSFVIIVICGTLWVDRTHQRRGEDSNVCWTWPLAGCIFRLGSEPRWSNKCFPRLHNVTCAVVTHSFLTRLCQD